MGAIWWFSLLNGRESFGSHVGFFRFTMVSSDTSGMRTFSLMCASVASLSTMTGVRYASDRLNARIVSVYASDTEFGTSTITGWSPCVPQRDCMKSPCAGTVATPWHGPCRITSMSTQGISAIMP